MPLLPDIGDHLWFGQGLQSIMWTDAQLFQQIFPVNHAHNAFLDLLLDFGVIGAIPVWSGMPTCGLDCARARTDPDPQFRAFFFGGHLALLSFFLYAVTNSRLTPTAQPVFCGCVVGVLLGRVRQEPDARARQICAERISESGADWWPRRRVRHEYRRLTERDMCGITGFFAPACDVSEWAADPAGCGARSPSSRSGRRGRVDG